MQSGGGFIIDDLSTVFDYDDTGGRPTAQNNEQNNSSSSGHRDNGVADSVATPKPLSSKQEAKLRSFLDGALEEITRGYRKRFDPSSPLHTLTSYLAEWMRLLGVLAHVPPYGSGSTNLLVSYLLRCSTDLSDGITGYSLAMEVEALKRQRRRQKQQRHGDEVDEADRERGEDDKEEDSDSDGEEERQFQIALRTKQLNLALQTLDLLDRIWAAVLRGNLINLPVALSNARKAFPDSEGADAQPDSGNLLQSRRPQLAPAAHSTSSLVPLPAIDGRFVSSASASSSTSPRESLPIHGGRGNKTVGVTDQVRLRNIAISSRDKLFSWMRSELDAPAPPTMQEDEAERDEPRDNTLDGALDVKPDPDTVAEQADDDDAADFEDVEIDNDGANAEEGYVAAEDTEEHKHYQYLFDRKLDPDADDDDDEDDEPSNVQSRVAKEEDESDQTLGASVLGTVEAVTSNDPHDKRKRDDDSEISPQVDEPRADGLPSKRRRTASADANEDEDADTNNGDANVKMARSELGSINFSLSDAIGQWDVAFTRLFSRTLRTLSDLSDFAKRGGRTDFTSSLAGISGADEHEAADVRQ